MKKLSFAEENYLKAVYHLSEAGEKEVSTNAIAEEMQTKAASVSDMLRRLSEKELVIYKKYQGVKISESGKKSALQVIRKHRLWEVFLVEKLKIQLGSGTRNCRTIRAYKISPPDRKIR